MAWTLAYRSAAALLAGSLLTAPLAGPAAAQDQAAFDREERAAIERIVRDYLIANPQIMLEVQEALETRQIAEQEQMRQQVIAAAQDELFRDPADPVLGNPDGDVTIVEFFDYNCGFCRRAMEDMNTLIAADPNLRFVLKEFPILGEDSQGAHVVAMAFNRLMPDAYGQFHERLMEADSRADEASAMALAVELGADEAALRAEMQNPAIAGQIQSTYQLAEALGISGTPSYVVGNELVPGALGEQVLREKIEAARAAN